METIDHIPVTLCPDAIAKRLRHNPGRAGAVNLDKLLAQARRVFPFVMSQGPSSKPRPRRPATSSGNIGFMEDA